MAITTPDPATRAIATSANYSSALYRYYALGVFTLAFGLAFVDRQILSILQEPIKADLGLSDAQLGLLTGIAFSIFHVTAGVPIARLADHGVRRTIVSVSVAFWSVMTAVSGFAGNFWQLFAARIGIGVGEAGCTPPCHSMISDIFPPERRGGAIAIYMTGISIGIMFGFLLGGWLNEELGWRKTFMVVGLPGLVIALLIRFTIAEPPRGLVDGKAASTAQIPLREVFVYLWSRRTMVHLIAAMSLTSVASNALITWIAPYMIRTHHVGTAELGVALAIGAGLFGAMAHFASGFASDWLGARDKRWYLWLPIGAILLTLPCFFIVMDAATPKTALSVFALQMFFNSCGGAGSFAIMMTLAPPRMRAMSSAISVFFANLIGLGLGPFAVGALSDILAPQAGALSLNYAMKLVIPTAGLWAALHYLIASTQVRRDLQAAAAATPA